MNTAIFSRICPPAFSEDSGSSSQRLPWFAVTLFTVALCFVVSNLIPFLTDLMGFIGASCGMFTTYIFPCVFSLKLLRHELSPAGVLAIKLVTVLALIVSGVGVYGTVADIVQNVRHESMGVFTC